MSKHRIKVPCPGAHSSVYGRNTCSPANDTPKTYYVPITNTKQDIKLIYTQKIRIRQGNKSVNAQRNLQVKASTQNNINQNKRGSSLSGAGTSQNSQKMSKFGKDSKMTAMSKDAFVGAANAKPRSRSKVDTGPVGGRGISVGKHNVAGRDNIGVNNGRVGAKPPQLDLVGEKRIRKML